MPAPKGPSRPPADRPSRFCPNCGGALQSRLLEGRWRDWCPACQRVHFANPKLAVGVIVAKDGLVALGRRGAPPGMGLWSFPAGYVDQGEVVEEAACREVREEMGLEVRLTGLVGLYSEANNPVALAVYAGEVLSGAIRPGSDMREVGWFSPERLPSLAFQRDLRIFDQWRTLQAPGS